VRGCFRTKPKLLAEVLIRVVTLPEFARYSSHKANNNVLYRGKAIDPDKTPFRSVRVSISLVVEL
jgi:hypothetical protein